MVGDDGKTYLKVTTYETVHEVVLNNQGKVISEKGTSTTKSELFSIITTDAGYYKPDKKVSAIENNTKKHNIYSSEFDQTVKETQKYVLYINKLKEDNPGVCFYPSPNYHNMNLARRQESYGNKNASAPYADYLTAIHEAAAAITGGASSAPTQLYYVLD